MVLILHIGLENVVILMIVEPLRLRIMLKGIVMVRLLELMLL